MSYSEYLEIGTSNEFTESMLSNNVFYMELNSGTVICHTCIMVVATLDDEGLVTFSNGSAQLNTSMVDKLFISREDSMTLLCLPPSRTTTTETAPPQSEIQKYQDILTFALCLVSICFLILFFVAFCLVKRMRNIPGSTIAGNMLMFLLAYVFFLARGFNHYFPDKTACYTMAVLVNYFFIGAFVFMIIYAVLIIRSLEFVDLDSRYTPITVAKIWIGGFTLPFVVIVPALILDYYLPKSPFSPGYGRSYCFMGNREGNIIFFIAPIALCLTLSVIIYIVVVLRLRQIAAATSRVRASHKEKVFLCFKLIIVLGFNWLSGIVAAAIDRNDYPVASQIFETIFIVLCCLHGFFGFLVFVASGSNIQLLKARYHQLLDTSTTSGGGKATRTYSSQPQSSTVASELSTMIVRKPSPKQSPEVVAKFQDQNNHNHYSSTHDTLNPSTDDKSNGSPMSNRSTSSKQKCDFF